MAILLRNVTTADGRVLDVRIDGGVIAAAGSLAAEPADAVEDLTGWLLVAAPVEIHAHLDKAYTAERVPNPKGDLYTAIDRWRRYRVTLTVPDIAERARTAALELVGNGITIVRTHVDVGEGIGLASAEALVTVRDELRGIIDIEIVGLVSSPTTGLEGADNRAYLRDALDLGIDVVGGCPHIEPDPRGTIDFCLGLADEHAAAIDLHTDETLDARTLDVVDLAAAVRGSGFGRGVVASHCVSLGVQELDVQRRIADQLAEAGVAVATLPQTNLFLQGRDHRSSVPRGLTAVRALLDAGVVVAGGADNVQDPFNTMGRSDPFETAALLVMAAHLTPEEAWDAVTSAPRRALGLPVADLTPGSPAHLLAVRAPSLRAAIASAPADRIVWNAGREVARTTTTRWIASAGTDR